MLNYLILLDRKDFNNNLRNTRHAERKIRWYVDYRKYKLDHPKPEEYHEFRSLLPGDNDERVKDRERETHVTELYNKYGDFYAQIKKNPKEMRDDAKYQATVPKNEDRRKSNLKRPARLVPPPEQAETAAVHDDPFGVDDLLDDEDDL